VNRAGSDDAWLDQDFLRKQYAQDFCFINDVRESSGHILAAARKLSDDGHLQYCPVRLFLRIVAASIFLLKAISLGSREADANASLDQLDRCIEALMFNRVDDIHLCSRYAELIARHVRRFKRNLRRRTPVQCSKLAPGPDIGSSVSGHGLSGLQTPSRPQQDGMQPQNHHMESNVLDMPFNNAAEIGASFEFGNDGANALMDDWLAQPFNPQVAPFSLETMQPSSGLAIDSLDFLWNMQGL